MTRRHVNLVGTGRHLSGLLPDGETWSLNVTPCQAVLDRLTRSFQIHPRHGRTANEDLWLETCPVRLYVRASQDARKNPHAVVFPWQSVPASAPISSSFDCMMFLALRDGFHSIYIANTDLQAGSLRERLVEHVSMAYWIGVAGGMGVQVEIEGGSKLLDHPLRYGLDYAAERRWGQQMATDALRVTDLDDGGAKLDGRIRGIHQDGKRPDLRRRK